MLSYLFLKSRHDKKVLKLESKIQALEERCDRLSDSLAMFGTSIGMKHVEKRRSEVEMLGLSDPPVLLRKEDSSATRNQARSSAAAGNVNSTHHLYVDHSDVPTKASHSSFTSSCSTSSRTSNHSSFGESGRSDYGRGGDDSGSSYDSGSSSDSGSCY